MSGYLSPESGAHWLRIFHPVFIEPVNQSLELVRDWIDQKKRKKSTLIILWLQLLQKTRFFKFKSCNPLPENFSTSHPLNKWGFQKVIKRNKRSKLTSCAPGYPQRTKAATVNTFTPETSLRSS